jgi:hypothetical protein
MEYKEKYFSFLIYNDIKKITKDDDKKVDVDKYCDYVMATIPCIKVD